MLCLDRIMAMCLNLSGAIVIVSEHSMVEEFHLIMEALLVADGFGCVCQCEKHSLLVCQMVVQPAIQIGVVGMVFLYSLTQGAMWSSVYISRGKGGGHVSPSLL
jgi:hypothetical protein